MIKTKTKTNYKKNNSPKKEKYKNINYDKIKQMEFLKKVTNDFPELELPPNPFLISEFSKTNKNVGIIFWYLPATIETTTSISEETSTNKPQNQKIQILTGMETCYLTDKVVPEIKSILQKYELYYSIAPLSSEEEQKVYQQFSKRAQLLSKELKQPIYFDKPISHPTQPQLWHTHFRVKGEIPKFGILKGSVEENESQIQAIHREIQEELFPYDEYIPLDPDKINLLPEPIKLNQDSLYTFHYQVSEREKQIIENNIKRLEKENYGEIVHYQFRTMNEIFTSPQSTQPNYHLLKQYFNGKSRLYINDFYHYLCNNENIKT